MAANLTDALESSTLRRRKMIGLSLGIGLGAFGVGTLVAFVGGLIKTRGNRWCRPRKARRRCCGRRAGLPDIRVKRSTWPRHRPTRRPAVCQDAPEDIDAGGMETVFPWRESDGDGTTPESHEKLLAITMGVRNPVMLIRIRPTDMPKVVKRKGQESFNFGEFFAFTKVCSHLGCPSSLYEQQSYRILCPCHQSQFNALEYAKPIFGPAARALAQLPITIDTNGYFVANGDFIEPVGPAFWERTT
ncbi:rieske domain protein [Mycobacterium xenopi 4042]|uniref:Cytochrome bc1 complex Rieske iron-sulfur subunit n=1 Tax=Mycobacterium xenopi 4042 TaxID=1299334 RepID=X8DDM1_MYCXE|nr:rieske domain protein [Mycobacterium xenopi 4042]